MDEEKGGRRKGDITLFHYLSALGDDGVHLFHDATHRPLRRHRGFYRVLDHRKGRQAISEKSDVPFSSSWFNVGPITGRAGTIRARR
ncbi:hypothetical protein [Humisphaera borealis]|uniref:hypothetical protein n=1 Tax=Humisphaera borealis TaxID=2807512 RepID=UPI0019D302FE|nr:hypothetical protein [Humisphaera borealis]